MWKYYLPLEGSARFKWEFEDKGKGNLFCKSFSPQHREGLFGKGLANEHTRLRRFVGACSLVNCALAILQRD